MDQTFQIQQRQKINQDVQTHLSDYMAVIFKHRWITLFCFFVIMASTAIFSICSSPVYQATAQIMISGRPSPLNPLGEDTSRGFSQNEYFQTQVNLLRNRNLAAEVISKLNLEQEFSGDVEEDGEIESVRVQSTEDDAGLNPKVIDRYLQYIEVNPVVDSNLVYINFYGDNPELIAKIVNKHAQTAIERNVRLQKEQAGEILGWLKKQIENKKDEVEKAQKKVQNYKTGNDLLSVDDQKNLISLELDAINSDLIEARNLRIEKQAAYAQLENIEVEQHDRLILPEIINDSVVLNLRNRLVDLNARKVEMATKYGNKHPKMIQLNLGIDQLKAEINAEFKRLRNAAKADLNRAISIEEDLKNTLETRKQVARELGEKGIKFDVLKQQAETSEEIYNFLLKQSEEINLSKVMDASSVQIVDRAEIPQSPIKPNHMVNIAMGIVIGLLFSTGLAFFIEYMDTTVRNEQDIKDRLSLSVLGMVPYDKQLEKNAALALPWNEDPETIKRSYSSTPYYPTSNRFPILFEANSKVSTCRVVAIESATMEEGKTTIAIKAASSMAASGMSVLLIDGDFLRPKLSQTFGIHNGNGLTSFVKKIQEFDLDYGDLSTCSIDDLFFLITLKKKSGKLIIQNSDNQMMEIFFQNGKMIHLQYPKNQDANRLGNMLCNSRVISSEQLKDALSRNDRTGQPIGYILVNLGYLTRDKLQGPLRLQMEENLQKLFSWKSGNFKFLSGSVNTFTQEGISFDEEYSDIINKLGKVEGSRLIEQGVFSQIKKWYADNLYVLPAGYGGIQSNFYINKMLMRKTLEILKQNFDVIVVDTSPIEAQADAVTLSSLADDIIFVIKAGKLSHKILNQAKNTLPQEKIVGAILNQVKINGSSYYNYH